MGKRSALVDFQKEKYKNVYAQARLSVSEKYALSSFL